MIRMLLVFTAALTLYGEMPQLVFQPAGPARVRLEGGPLGAALERNLAGYLNRFVTGPDSPQVRMFFQQRSNGAEQAGAATGQWLVAAARAAQRSGDTNLALAVKDVTDALIAAQQPDGYLGTCQPALRFTSPSAYRMFETWDLWVHGQVLDGILEVNRYWPDPRYLQAARRIGDLIETTLRGDRSAAYLGSHRGLAGVSVVDPVMDLYFATKDAHYLLLARRILEQADERPDLQFVLQSRKKASLATIGDGHIASLLSLYSGVVKLYRASGEALYLDLAKQAWNNVRTQHLTPGGGPWGRTESFDDNAPFDPAGIVDLCALLRWIDLNRELLIVTGDARYADEIERTAYNDLLSAQLQGGWCAQVRSNGSREPAAANSVCAASASLAVESIPSVAAGPLRDGWAINLYASMRLALMSKDGLDAEFAVKTLYPFQPEVEIRALPRSESEVSLYLRLPAWTKPSLELNGLPFPIEAVDGYARITRRWKRGDTVVLRLPLSARVLNTAGHAALMRGPLSYAAGLDQKPDPEIVLPAEALSAPASVAEVPDSFALDWKLPNHEPIRMVPAHLASRRWRITWWRTE